MCLVKFNGIVQFCDVMIYLGLSNKEDELKLWNWQLYERQVYDVHTYKFRFVCFVPFNGIKIQLKWLIDLFAFALVMLLIEDDCNSLVTYKHNHTNTIMKWKYTLSTHFIYLAFIILQSYLSVSFHVTNYTTMHIRARYWKRENIYITIMLFLVFPPHKNTLLRISYQTEYNKVQLKSTMGSIYTTRRNNCCFLLCTQVVKHYLISFHFLHEINHQTNNHCFRTNQS